MKIHSICAALTMCGLGILAIPGTAQAQSFGDPGFSDQGGGVGGVNYLSVAGDFWDQPVTGPGAIDGISLDLAFTTNDLTSPITENIDVNGQLVGTVTINPGDTGEAITANVDPSLVNGPSFDVNVAATNTPTAGGVSLALDGSSTIALTPVREPASMAALLTGIAGIVVLRRRRVRRPETRAGDGFTPPGAPAAC